MKRYEATRGAYVNTTDDRADRWYVNDTESTVVDRRGSGYRTKKEAQAVCNIKNKGLDFEDERIELYNAGLI